MTPQALIDAKADLGQFNVELVKKEVFPILRAGQ